MKNNDFSQSIKEWYTATYPTDNLGSGITGTFEGAMQCLLSGGEFYAYLSVTDSLVRERIFRKLSEMLGVDYDEIYRLWINETISLTLFKKLAENGLCVVTATQKKGE